MLLSKIKNIIFFNCRINFKIKNIILIYFHKKNKIYYNFQIKHIKKQQ
jgi:hypothetical protein